MLSSDILFSRLHDWHHVNNRACFALLGHNENAIALLSASNMQPVDLSFVSGDDGAAVVSRRGGGTLCVRSVCCQETVVLSLEELSALLRLTPSSMSMAPLTPSSSVAHGLGSDAAVVENLLCRSHGPTCPWWGRRPVTLLLHPNSLALEDSLVVRARCAALRLDVPLNNNNNNNNNNNSSNAKPQKQRFVLPRGTPPRRLLAELEHIHQHVLRHTDPSMTYSGSNTSSQILSLFFPASLKQRKRQRSSEDGHDVEEEEDSLDVRTVRHLCLLLLLYGYTIEAVPASNSGKEDAIISSSDDLSSQGAEAISHFRARCGFVVRCRFCSGVPPVAVHSTMTTEPIADEQEHVSNTPESNGEGVRTMEAKEDSPVPEVDTEKEHNEEEEGVVAFSESASPCDGGELLADTTVVDADANAEVDAEATVEIVAEDTIASEPVEPFIPQRIASTYNLTLSANTALNGHCACCPWKRLFVDGVVDAALAASPQRAMEFNFKLSQSNSEKKNVDTEKLEFPHDEEEAQEQQTEVAVAEADTLTLRFFLGEVERLISCWRASEDLEARFRNVYSTHPLADLTSSSSAEQVHSAVGIHGKDSGVTRDEVEAFLTKLRSQLNVGDADDALPRVRATIFYSPNAGCVVHGASSLEEVAVLVNQAPISPAPTPCGSTTTSWDALVDQGEQLRHGEGSITDFVKQVQQRMTAAPSGLSGDVKAKQQHSADAALSWAMNLLYADVTPIVAKTEIPADSNDEETHVTTAAGDTQLLPPYTLQPPEGLKPISEDDRAKLTSYEASLTEAVAALSRRRVAAQVPPAPKFQPAPMQHHPNNAMQQQQQQQQHARNQQQQQQQQQWMRPSAQQQQGGGGGAILPTPPVSGILASNVPGITGGQQQGIFNTNQPPHRTPPMYQQQQQQQSNTGGIIFSAPQQSPPVQQQQHASSVLNAPPSSIFGLRGSAHNAGSQQIVGGGILGNPPQHHPMRRGGGGAVGRGGVGRGGRGGRGRGSGRGRG